MSSRRSRQRRGTVLILFVMLLFVFLGFCALIIDLGMARVAQRQMQSAVDTAALESFRHRDDPAAAATHANAMMSSVLGRARNSLQLRPNSENDQAGDIVQGTYGVGVTHSDYSDEQADYSRRDFRLKGELHDGVLVRLRRTNETFANDDPNSSAGPAVPLLFGLGTTVNSQQKLTGIPVRATAIASHGTKNFADLKAGTSDEKGRVMSAGPVWSDSSGVTQPKVAGLAPLGLMSTFWTDFPTDNKSLTIDGAEIRHPDRGVIGFVIDSSPLAIGQSLVAASNSAPLSDIEEADRQFHAYAPIYIDEQIASQPSTVIGFGFVTWNLNELGELLLSKRPGEIALGNATPTLSISLPGKFSDEENDPDFAQLWELHRTLQDALFSSPPVLVNRHIGPTPAN